MVGRLGVIPSNIQRLFCTHLRRPRGSQSGREKRRDESFQVRAKEPLGTDSHRAISKNSSWCRLLIGHKNALYYCAQSANSFSWVLFVSSYTTAIVSITACLAHAPKKCTQSGNFQFDIKSPSDFKILSARKLKTLFQKYKLELTTSIHACICSHVLRKYKGVFKRYHDDWQPPKTSNGKGNSHFFQFLSWLFRLPYFFKCKRTLLELNFYQPYRSSWR